jgi:hypothetical protein
VTQPTPPTPPPADPTPPPADPTPPPADPTATPADSTATPADPTATPVDGATAETSAVTIDLDAERVGDAAGAPEVPRRRPRVVALVAAGVTLALMVGVGIGYRVLSGDGRKPEQFTPASVAAFVSIDLDPGIGQQVSLWRLAGKLPKGSGAGEVSSAQGAAERLLTQLNLSGVDVKRDLMSWLGLRAAVSAWTDSGGRTYGLFAALSKDDSAADEALRRLADSHDLGFVVKDGTVLIAVGEDAQRAAQEAADEAARAPLADLAGFRQAREWLADDQVLLVWADLTRAGSMMMGAIGPDSPMPEEMKEAFVGTAVLGVRAADDGIEARYRTFGAGRKAAGGADALARLGALPGNSAAGAAVTLADDFGPSRLSSFSATGLAFGGLGLPLLFSGIAAEPTQVVDSFGNLSPSERAELDRLMNKDPATLTEAENKRLIELGGWGSMDPNCGLSSSPQDLSDKELAELTRLGEKDPADLTKAERKRFNELLGFDPEKCGLAQPGSAPSDEDMKELERLMSKDPATLTDAERERYAELTGIDPTDMGGPIGAGFGDSDLFNALRGASVDVAVLGGDAEPRLRISATTASTDAAEEFARLLDGIGTADEFDTTVQGKAVTATSPGFAPDGGTLADVELFRRTMPALPGSDVAAFVNFQAMPADGRPDFPLHAIGVIEGVRDGDLIGTARFIIG